MDRRLRRRLRLVRVALWAERLAPGLCWIAALVALAAALALFDIVAVLPGWLHALLLLALAGGLAGAAWSLCRLSRPGEDEVQRRLESDSGVLHRPLATLSDDLAQGDPVVWAAHRRRMAEQTETLRPGWPRPILAARDPLALRYIPLLLLVLAVAGGWHDAGNRIGRFLTPALGLPGLGPSALTVWVTPPAATGLPPVTLSGSAPISIPVGSTIGVALSGGWGGAALRAGETRQPLTADGHGGQRGEAVMAAGDVLAVEQLWRSVAEWRVELVPDRPPEIKFTQLPEGDERGRLRFGIEAVDDYGLARVGLEMRPLEAGIAAPPEDVPLSLPADRPRSVSLAPRLDLAAHDWAGREVILTPLAEDTHGQISRGDHVALVLPERHFRHPLAKLLVQWRQEASDAPRRGPDIAENLAEVLGEADHFGGDSRVVLALALARSILSSAAFDRSEMRDLLWNAATRLEDGGASAAEQAMEEARRDLERALAEGAPPEVLSRLLDRFEAALGRWLEAMESRGQSQGEAGGDVLTDEDLAAGLDELRALAESGDRESLRRRLAEMAETLSRLAQPGQGGGALPEDVAKALADLRKLAARQQDLLDQSFRNAPPLQSEGIEDDPSPSTAKAGKGEAKAAAKAQSELEKALAGLAGGMASPPQEMGRAARAMTEAAEALGRGDWAQAAEAQTEALAALRGAGRQMIQSAQAGKGGKGGVAGVRRDPFGRAVTGQDSSVKVPAAGETQRAREILNELRGRASDSARPASERDYLRRLLKQF